MSVFKLSLRRPRHRLAVVVGASAIVALLSVTAVVVASDSGGLTDGAPVQYEPVGSLPTAGASASVISQSLAKAFPLITSVVTAGGALVVHASVPSLESPQWVEGDWETKVFSGAYADELASAKLPPPSSMDTVLTDPSGKSSDAGGGAGNVVADQVYPNQSQSALTAQIQKGASSVGLTHVSVSYLPGLTSSIPVISAVASDPGRFVGSLSSYDTYTQLLGQDPHALEAYFLDVKDASGNEVYVTGAASRLGASEAWTNPDITPTPAQ